MQIICKALDTGVGGLYYSYMATPKEKYAEMLLKYNELVVKYEVACETIDKLQARIEMLLPNLRPV